MYIGHTLLVYHYKTYLLPTYMIIQSENTNPMPAATPIARYITVNTKINIFNLVWSIVYHNCLIYDLQLKFNNIKPRLWTM